MSNLIAYYRKVDGTFRSNSSVLTNDIEEAARITPRSNIYGEPLHLIRPMARAPIAMNVPYELKSYRPAAQLKYRREGDPWHTFDYGRPIVNGGDFVALPFHVSTLTGDTATVFRSIGPCWSIHFQKVIHDNTIIFAVEGKEIVFEVRNNFGIVAGRGTMFHLPEEQPREFRPELETAGNAQHRFG